MNAQRLLNIITSGAATFDQFEARRMLSSLLTSLDDNTLFLTFTSEELAFVCVLENAIATTQHSDERFKD